MDHLINATPEFLLEDILSEGIPLDRTFFVGCVSYEDRSLSSIRKIIEKYPDDYLHTTFFKIEDDECTYDPWKDECSRKLDENVAILRGFLDDRRWSLSDHRMSDKAEHVLHMKDEIHAIIEREFRQIDDVCCVLDVTCLPSYFAMQLLKVLMEADKVKDLILLYTKPMSYAPGDLKSSPRDFSRVNFLPFFGNVDLKNVNWIVGVGFDYNSVSNASLIKETLTIENTKVIVPFPGYKHEFFLRTVQQNSAILDDHDNDYSYVKADSPFLTFTLVDNLINGNNNCILSSFGPKPMCLGFGLAAIKNNTPILHVQATNYNPNFSTGEKETHSYLFKARGKSFLTPQ